MDSPIKRPFQESEYSPENIQDLRRCASDPIFFIENYVMVQHPTKGNVPMVLYDYQKEMLRAVHENKDTIILASRQLGKCCSADTTIDIIKEPVGSKRFIFKLFGGNFNDVVTGKPAHGPIMAWCLSRRAITIGEFHKLNNPQDCKINDANNKLKFLEIAAVDEYYVRTNVGYSKIQKSLKTIEYVTYNVELQNGLSLACADEHIVIDKDYAEIYAKDLDKNHELQTIYGPSVVKSVTQSAQQNMYDLELSDHHLYWTNGILSHNTTVVAMYILWMTCFKNDKLCILASKAMSHATEIMGRIKYAYEELPTWLKPGCRYYSRTSIEFENGSKIKSEATSEKTGRGSSPSFLMIDEIAFLSKRIQDEMWASLAPSLSTGGKFVITSTPNGDGDLFATLWRGANSQTNSFYPVKAMWHQHPDRGQEYYAEMLGKLGELKCNQELNCEFISSDALLINSLSLYNIRAEAHLSENMGVKFWLPDTRGARQYLVGVDLATGTGSDFTVAEVFEFPSLEQVAELRLNSVNIPLIYAKLKWLFKHLTAPSPSGERAQVLWSFERNGVGEALVAMIQNDDSADGGVYIDNVDLFNENPMRLGCYTTGSSKLQCCMQIKHFIEKTQHPLTVKSPVLLEELKNFIATGGTYRARPGATDDAVMALAIVMKLVRYLSTYDDRAHRLVYEAVNPDSDISSVGPDDNDSFGDEPAPFVIL